MSFSKKVVSCRDDIFHVVCSYLECARGITNLEEEDDIEDFKSLIDGILEENVARFKVG